MRKLSTIFLSCGIAFAMVSTLAAQTVEGHATVVRVKGSARASEGGSWKNLKVGDVIKPGSLIQTGLQNSYVDIVLNGDGSSAPMAVAFNGRAAGDNKAPVGTGYRPQAEQNVVRVNENTALGIDKLTSQNTGSDIVTETQLDLKQGRITGNVKKLSAASKYEIKLPNGVAGIRGTVYDISAEGVVKVAVGSVVVAIVGPDGNVVTHIVKAGEQFDARTGQITPLGAGEIDDIIRVSGQMFFRGVARPTTFIVDKTIVRVSPIGGEEGANNDGGEGEQYSVSAGASDMSIAR